MLNGCKWYLYKRNKYLSRFSTESDIALPIAAPVIPYTGINNKLVATYKATKTSKKTV